MSRYIGVAFSQSDPRSYPSLAPTFLSFKNALTGSDITKPPISQLGTEGIYGFTYTASVPTYFLLDGITTTTSSDRYVFGIIDSFHQVDEQLTAASATLQALGNSCIALGNTNVALGTTAVALGTTSVALGTTGVALSTTAVALGNTGVAFGQTSVALGTSNFAFNTSIFAQSVTISAQAVSISAQCVTIISLAQFGATNSAEILLRIGTTASSFGTTLVDPGDLFGFLKRAQEFREGDQTFNKTTGAWNISTRGGTLLVTKTLVNSSTEVTKT